MAERPKALYTISEAAAELGVHPDTLRAWSDKGLVPVTMLPSGYRRYSREQLDAIQRHMLERRTPEPPAESE